jgi:hypothetical protein
LVAYAREKKVRKKSPARQTGNQHKNGQRQRRKTNTHEREKKSVEMTRKKSVDTEGKARICSMRTHT